jgi:hypothetical protein
VPGPDQSPKTRLARASDGPAVHWPGRLSQARFPTSRWAALALTGAFVGFHALAWAIHECTNPGHHAPVSFLAHLRHVPDELLLQLLFMPLAMHFAIPALFHAGSLFEWNPGYWAPRAFAVAYWFTLLAGSRALVVGRRVLWLLVIGVLLLASAPRFVELIGVALSDS